jgi:hypothetical protein
VSSFTWQTNSPEDFEGLQFGSGWISTPEAVAAMPVSDALGATIVIEGHREDLAAKRELERRGQASRERAEWLQTQARLGLRTGMVSHGEVLARFARGCQAQDNRQRAEELRVLAGVRNGELEVRQPAPPSMRSERLSMERQQRERSEARAVQPVQGSEFDELRDEITRLKSLLNSQGIRAV